MDGLNSLLAFLAGLGLRLAIPLAITILTVYILRKVDERWQAEAGQVPPTLTVEKPRCWEIKKCAPELRRACPSPTSPEPCWQIHRKANGYLSEACLTCDVFCQAPVPAPTAAHTPTPTPIHA